MKSSLRELSQLFNISEYYVDKMNKIHYTTDSLRKNFLKSLGYDVSSQFAIKEILKSEIEKRVKNGFDYVHSFFSNEKLNFDLCIPEKYISSKIKFKILKGNEVICVIEKNISKLKIKETIELSKKEIYYKINISLNNKFTPDYYTLIGEIENFTYSTFVIIAPQYAYLPPSFLKGKKILGLGLQLYSLQSKKSMGIGDFTSLEKIIRIASKYGCDSIGVNPLGAMYSKSKKDVSPYRVLSREYLNYIYLDLTTIEDFKKSAKIKEIISSKSYKNSLKKLQNAKFINYEKVFEFKFSLLKEMYKYFKKYHLAKNTTRAKLFSKFKTDEGKSLENLCIFESILEKDFSYWKNWQNKLNDINSQEIEKFKNTHKSKIDFYAYLHWLCHIELNKLKRLTEKLKMKIGLYLDIPVGAASNGCEVWQYPSLFANDIDIGTPPDTIRPKGQTWGLIPPNPIKLKETHYNIFIKLLRHNMRYAGAIRLDHSFSLMRLFWVDTNKNGAYIHYNLKDMTAILCLESHKNKCVVIGEDLGNVPDGFYEFMQSHKILSNKVLFRQKDKNGKFLQVDKYPYLSLCQVSTHDQATCYGFWVSEDIEINNKYHLFPKQQQYKKNLLERSQERKDIIKILNKTSSFYNNKDDFKFCVDGKCIPKNLEYSFNIYGAKTQSAIFQLKFADIYQQIEMENVPSTVDEYPNWRIKYPILTDNIDKDKRMKNLFSVLVKYRK